MSKNQDRDNNSHTQEDLHDDELGQAFLALRKQLVRVTKEKQELIREVDQLKTANQYLKRMIGNHDNALAATVTSLPVQEVSPDSKILVPKPVKLTASAAKLPKVMKSVAEIATFSSSFGNKTVNFSFGPGQPDRKLNLTFEYTTKNYTNTYNLNMATIYTETQDMACLDKCDYFIHICAVNEGSRSTDSKDQCWFQIITSSKIVKSSKRDKATLEMDNGAIQIKYGGDGFQAKKGPTHQLDIIVTMSLFLYDSTSNENSTSTSTPSASREARTAKLLDFKSQMHPTTNIHAIEGHSKIKRLPVSKSIAERTLLDSGSPIFNTDLKSVRSFSDTGIHFNLTQKSIDAFSNWVYGIDTKEFTDDIQLNMEVLCFAHEFWICDLFKFCIDNICRILENNFTLELLVKVWKFEEQHKIRNLDECLREVIQTKAKTSVDFI